MSKRKKEKKKKSIWKEILSVFLLLVLLFGGAWLLAHYVGEKTIVSGESMYPVMSNGDHLIVDKISYRFMDPQRFDVVVFPFRYQENTYYIKRVIGLPGETVQISDGKILINGKVLDDAYGYGVIQNAGLASDRITLGRDEYFVLGDNRNNSSDSREPSVGNVQRDLITGRAVFCVWPLSHLGFIR